MPFTSRDEALQKVRIAQQNLLTQGNPLGIVGRGIGDRVSTLPTYEREAKSGHGMTEVVLRSPTGRLSATKRERSPIEAHQKSFTEEELYIAALFVADAEMATRVNVTAAYDGAPREVAGPRAGGVIDRHRQAHVRFYKALSEMDEKFRHVAKWLVLEVRRENTGETASVGDIGAEMTGLKHVETCRGVGLGMLKATLWRIGEVYRREMRGK